MMVYLIDSTAPQPPALTTVAGLRADTSSLEENWDRRIRLLPGHTDAQLIMVQPTETVADITTRVIAAVEQQHRIWMLRIIAHGIPGFMYLGRGVGSAEAPMFRPLRPFFSVTGRGVEIHSCNLGEGRSGRRLVQRLSNAFGQPVAASPHLQLADNGFRFEGTVTRTDPRER